jgi:CBS domain-containing protein
MRLDAPVSHFVSSPVAACAPTCELSEVRARLDAAACSALAVTAPDGSLIGTLSRTDLVRAGRLRATMAGSTRLLKLPRLPAAQRMSADVLTVDPDTPLRLAAARMVAAHVHRLFTVDGARADGILSTTDVMRAVAELRSDTPIGAIMSAPVITVQATDPVGLALDRLIEARVRGLVVTEGEWPVGVFTQAEALAAQTLDHDVLVELAMSPALLCVPSRTPIPRAAAFAVETRARVILAVDARALVGIATGLDVARYAALETEP